MQEKKKPALLDGSLNKVEIMHIDMKVANERNEKKFEEHEEVEPKIWGEKGEKDAWKMEVEKIGCWTFVFRFGFSF